MMNIDTKTSCIKINTDQVNENIVNTNMRCEKNAHKPLVVWFTGLSGSGKTTTAQALEYQLHSMGFKTFLLDGDIVRQGLCADLKFSEEDRHENLRRMAHIAKILFDAGLIVLVSVISPFEQDRQFAKSLFSKKQFLEVYMNTPLQVCETRDPKGLYKQARSGKLANFTGIDAVYQPPTHSDFRINTERDTTADIVSLLLPEIKTRCWK